jgi:hypothetical protein
VSAALFSRSLVSRLARPLAASVLLATLLVAACSSLLMPHGVDVPQARLQELLERHFPVNKRLFDAIDVTLDSPRLTLHPESNRVAIELALTAGNGGAATSPLRGDLLVSEGLRFEPSDNTLRLVDLRVERFVIDGLPGSWQRQLDRFGKPLAEALLDDRVIYALRPKDIAALEGRGVRPGELRVTESGITITLQPAAG